MKNIRRKHISLDGMRSLAIFSPCEKYRYVLSRTWDPGAKSLCFLMLNPSTATEEKNDPTIERCERRARSAGYGGLDILNIFAFRATDPADMKLEEDPIGPDNDFFLRKAMDGANDGFREIICGWGVHGSHLNRDRKVIGMFAEYGVQPMALNITKGGHPGHPLYVAYDKKPIPFTITRESV